MISVARGHVLTFGAPMETRPAATCTAQTVRCFTRWNAMRPEAAPIA